MDVSCLYTNTSRPTNYALYRCPTFLLGQLKKFPVAGGRIARLLPSNLAKGPGAPALVGVRSRYGIWS